MTDENSNRLWKMRYLFDILNEKFSKLYSPSEHLAVDEVKGKYKGRVIFRQNSLSRMQCLICIVIARNTSVSGSKFTNCVTRRDTRIIDILFGQRQTAHCATPDCDSRDSVRIDRENTRTWPQTVHGQLIFLPGLIR